jgi:predicted nuclease of restriction endonuclease-like (RecB) superfamily
MARKKRTEMVAVEHANRVLLPSSAGLVPETVAEMAPQHPDKLPAGYADLLESLKARIGQARTNVGLAVNQELLLLYYGIGLELDRRDRLEAWGSSVINRLSRDLRQAFPEMEGLSPRSLRRMRAFYRAYPLDDGSAAIWPQAVAKLDLVKWPPAVAKLPWAHNVILLEKCKVAEIREWYARAALHHGWSRNVLAMQIESGLHLRQGESINNFDRTLPPPHSDLAQQSLKDPYLFDFLCIGPEAHERAVEDALVNHITQFLLELGAGFAYFGRQCHLEVGDDDFYVDLVFYHVRLHCFVLLELKTGPFKPEYAGKMNFYLSAADDLLRSAGDGPSIGLILCRDKDRVTAEYALRDIQKPIGISEYQLTKALPQELKSSLPTIEQLERELKNITEP